MGTLEAQFKNQLWFCFCFFEIIGSLQKSYKNKKLSYIFHPDSPFVEICHVLLCRLPPYTHTHYYFLNHLRATCMYIFIYIFAPPLEQFADMMRQCVYPKDVVIHLHNCSTIINIGNLTSIRYYYLMYRPYSNFTNGPNNVWYTVPPPPPTC